MCAEACQILGRTVGTVIPLSVSRPRGRSADVPVPSAVEGDHGPKLVHGGDRFERARDHLGRAGAMRFVGQPAFEQLGVREDHAELIVQSVK